MIIKLIIDNRETELYNNIILRDLEVYNEKIKIEKRNLELGDIIIIIEDENNEENKKLRIVSDNFYELDILFSGRKINTI